MEREPSGALIEEAVKKSSLVWVTVGEGRARPVWHVWHEGALTLVCGGAEQPLPGLDRVGAGPATGTQTTGTQTTGTQATGAQTTVTETTVTEITVTARSKDKGGRLVAFRARPVWLEPGSPAWEAATAELSGKRLNAADTTGQPARWAAESVVLRLEPTGELVEEPGVMPTGSHAAPPAPSPARTPVRAPFSFGHRRTRLRATENPLVGPAQ